MRKRRFLAAFVAAVMAVSSMATTIPVRAAAQTPGLVVNEALEELATPMDATVSEEPAAPIDAAASEETATPIDAVAAEEVEVVAEEIEENVAAEGSETWPEIEETNTCKYSEDEVSLYAFTPSKSGYYVLICDTESVNITAGIVDEEETEAEKFGNYFYLEEGKSYEISLSFYFDGSGDEPEEVTFTWKAAKLDSIKEGENELSYNGGYIIATFTPTETGFYNLVLDKDVDGYIQAKSVYDKNHEEISEKTYYSNLGYYLKAEETYEINYNIYGYSTIDKVKFNWNRTAYITLKDGKNTCTYNSEKPMLYSYTPEEKHVYTPVATDTSYSLYYDIYNTNMESVSGEALEKDETYIVAVRFYKYGTAADTEVSFMWKNDAKIEIARGENTCTYAECCASSFKFTPDESGYYNIESKVSDYKLENVIVSQKLTSAGFYMSQGTEYTINLIFAKAGGEASADDKITFELNESELTEIEADTETEISSDNAIYHVYTFTPAESGFYGIFLEPSTVSIYSSIYDENRSLKSKQGQGYYLEAEKTYTTEISLRSNVDDVTFTLSKVDIPELEDENTCIVNVRGDYNNYFTYTPDKDGYFKIECEDDNFYLYSCSIAVAGNRYSSVSRYAQGYELKEGINYLITARFSRTSNPKDYNATEVIFNWVRSDAPELKEEEPNKFTYSNGYNHIYTFTPEKDGYYNYEFENENYSINTFYVKNGASTVYISDTGYKLSKDTVYNIVFSVYPDSSADENDELSLNWYNVKVTAISTGQGSSKYQEGRHSYFSFVPETSGYYQMECTDENFRLNSIDVNDPNNSYYYRPGKYAEGFYLYKETEYIINAEFVREEDSDPDDAEVSFDWGFAKLPVITTEGTNSCEYSLKSHVFQFIPDEDGYYNIDCEGSDFYVSSYLVYDDSHYSLSSNIDGYKLSKGVAYEFIVNFGRSSGTSEKIKFKLNKIPVQKLNVGEHVCTYEADTDYFYTFTPDKSGYYSIDCTDEEYSILSCSISSASSSSLLTKEEPGYYLRSGYTYIIKLSFDTVGTSSDDDVTFKLSPVTLPDIKESNQCVYEEDKTYVYKFTPDETGIYALTCTDEDYVVKSLKVEQKDSYSTYVVKYIQGYRLYKGTEYTISVSFDEAEGVEDASSDVTFDWKFADIENIEIGEAITCKYNYSYSNVFRFTPEETGYYNIRCISTDYTLSSSSVCTDSFNTISKTAAGYKLEEDKTYYIIPYFSYSYADTDAILELYKSDPEAVDEGVTDCDFEEGKSYIYTFTPADTGYYSIDCVTEGYSIDSIRVSDSGNYPVSKYVQGYSLYGDQTYYITLSFSDDGADSNKVGFEIKEVKLPQLKKKNICIYADGMTQVYTFTPDKTSRYKLSCADEDFNLLSVSVMSDFTYVYSDGAGYKLNEGDTYYISFYISGYGDYETKVTVNWTEIEIDALNVGSNTCLYDEDESLIFTFTPEESGYYSLLCKDDNFELSDYSICYYNYYGYKNVVDETAAGYYLSAGTEYFVEVKFARSEDGDEDATEVSFSFGLSEVPVLSLGENNCVYKAGSRYVYTFEATEDGIYDLTCTSEDYIIRNVVLTYSYGSSINKNVIGYSLNQGTEYRLQFDIYEKVDGEADDDEVTFDWNKINIPVIKLGNGLCTYKEGSNYYASFTPGESGYYRFSVTDSDYKLDSYKIYNSRSSSALDENSVGYRLSGGTEYIIEAVFSPKAGVKPADDEVSFSMKAATVPEILVGDNVCEYKGDMEYVFTFTPNKTCYYDIKCLDENYKIDSYYIYDENFILSATTIGYRLDKNTQYTIRINFVASEGKTDDEIQFSLVESVPDALTIDDNEITYEGICYHIYSFTPDEDGYYDIVCEGNPSCSIRKDSDYINASSAGFLLEADKTYEVSLYFSTYELSEGDELTLKIIKNELKDVSAGDNEIKYVEGASSFLKFTPEESGYYLFKCEDEEYSLAGCTIQDLNSSYTTIYSGVPGWLLRAGETYLIEADFIPTDDADDMVSYSLTLSDIPELALGSNSCEYAEGVHVFEFTPDNDGYYGFENTGKNYAVVPERYVARRYSDGEYDYTPKVTPAGVSLKAGETYHIFMTVDKLVESPASKKVTFKWNKIEPAVLSVGDNSCIYKNGKENVFLFAPEKTGYYRLRCGDEAYNLMSYNFENVEDYYGYSSLTSAGYFLYDYSVYLVTVEFEPEESGEDGDEIEFKLEKTLLPALSLGENEMDIEGDSSLIQVYTFTPEATGYYKLDCADTDYSISYKYVYQGNYYSNLKDTKAGYLLEADTEYRIEIRLKTGVADDGDGKVTYTLNKTVTPAITEGVNTWTYTDDYKYLCSFVPDQSGYYMIECMDEAFELLDYSVDQADYGNIQKTMSGCYLNAGYTYLFDISFAKTDADDEDDGEISFKVTKSKLETINLGRNDCDYQPNISYVYEFMPEADGFYKLSCENARFSINVYNVYDEYRFNEYSNSVGYYLAADRLYNIEVSFYRAQNTDIGENLIFKWEKVEPPTLLPDNNKAEYDFDMEYVYKFEPDETGYYKLTCTDDDFGLYDIRVNYRLGYGDETPYVQGYRLEAGNTYMISFYVELLADDIKDEFNFSLSKSKLPEIVEGVNKCDYENGMMHAFTFIPDNTGYFKASIDKGAYSIKECYVYDVEKDYDIDATSAGFSLKKGRTYEVWISFDRSGTSSSGKVSFNWEEIVPSDISEDEASCTYVEGKHYMFAFEPSANGYYDIKCSNAAYEVSEIKVDLDGDPITRNSAGYHMYSDNLYIIDVVFDKKNSTASNTFKVSFEQQDLPKLKKGDNTCMYDDGIAHVYSFTADESGYYDIKFTNSDYNLDKVAVYYNYNVHVSKTSAGYDIQAGEEYQIEISFRKKYSALSPDEEISFTWEKLATPAISEDGITCIYEEDKVYVYEFTPDESGCYKLGCDTEGFAFESFTVYNSSDGTEEATKDGYLLIAGHTYVINFTLSKDEAADGDEVEISLAKPTPAKLLAGENTGTYNNGKVNVYTFTATEDGNYLAECTDDDYTINKIFVLGDNGYLSQLSASDKSVYQLAKGKTYLIGISFKKKNTASESSENVSFTWSIDNGVHDHDYKDTVIAPTCIQKGYTNHKCTICGDEYVDTYTNIVSHQYVKAKTVAATCTEKGYTEYKCKNCTYAYKGDFTPATGHNYVTSVVTTAATCAKEGVLTKKCRCGAAITQAIPKDSAKHIGGTVLKNVKAASSTAKGYTGDTCCASCGAVITKGKDIPMLTKVKLAKVKISKLKNTKKGQLKVSWKKDKNASGYEIMYATNKKFSKGKKTALVKKNKTVTKTFKKLKKGKTYYVKVRSYKTMSGKKVYGAWSAVKKLKIKK